MSKKVTINDIAEELQISPKRARAILRKKAIAKPGTRWAWDLKEKATIKAAILGKPAPTKRPRSSTADDRPAMH